MSRILCVVDGMTDPQFQAADYPWLSTMELLGYEDSTRGREPDTLGCVLHFLGVDADSEKLRAYVEALGAGIPVSPEDLLLRGSWFSLDHSGKCEKPCRVDTVPAGDGFHYYSLGDYRALLVFPGLASQLEQIRCVSPASREGRQAADCCPRGSAQLADCFRRFLTRERCLLLWGQARALRLAPFPRRAGVVCGKNLIKGIARLLDMELIETPGADGDVSTNLEAKTRAALQAAERLPFVLLHINGADEAAHRKDPQEKKEFLHKVDRVVLSRLLDSPHELYVVSDHGTDPRSGRHLGTAQPVFRRKE